MTGRSLLAARAASSRLLATAGVLLVGSERVRWWPVCGFGGFDTTACELRQDRRFDQIVPLLSGRHDRFRRLVPGLVPAADRHGVVARWLVVGCTSASTPLVQYFLSPLLVLDLPTGTAPWSWAVSGVLLVVAPVSPCGRRRGVRRLASGCRPARRGRRSR